MKTLIALCLFALPAFPYGNLTGCGPLCVAIQSGYITFYSAGTITSVAINPLPYAPYKGTTATAIHSQFPKVILYNFTYSPSINTTIAGMQDIYLARLTRQYYIETGGNVAPLLRIAAIRLTAANLARVRASMGQAATDAAVNTYATATVKATYFATAPHPVIRRSEAMYLSMGIKSVTPAPNLDMTLYEIFLDYYTAGETSAAAALASTATYAGSYLAASFTVGYQVGSAIYWIDDKVDPDVNVWIGDELGAAATEIINYIENPSNYPAYEAAGLGSYGEDTYKWDNTEP